MSGNSEYFIVAMTKEEKDRFIRVNRNRGRTFEGIPTENTWMQISIDKDTTTIEEDLSNKFEELLTLEDITKETGTYAEVIGLRMNNEIDEHILKIFYAEDPELSDFASTKDKSK